MFTRAEERDLDRVYALYKRVLGQKFCVWNEAYPGMEEIRQDYAAGNLFILLDQGELLGALSIVPENELDGFHWHVQDGTQQEVARVVVSPGHQGKGLAGEMVRRIIPILRERGCSSIHLSVAKDNLPARKTYEKAGFCLVEEAQLYGGTYYLMEKQINKED